MLKASMMSFPNIILRVIHKSSLRPYSSFSDAMTYPSRLRFNIVSIMAQVLYAKILGSYVTDCEYPKKTPL